MSGTGRQLNRGRAGAEAGKSMTSAEAGKNRSGAEASKSRASAEAGKSRASTEAGRNRNSTEAGRNIVYAEAGRSRSSIIWALTAVLLIVIDQLTKLAAVKILKDHPARSIIPGVFELEYLENKGAAFGMMQNKHWIFILFALLIVVLAILVFRRIPQTRRFLPLQAICILMVSGAIGNMIDRILHEYVIDFLYFSLINFPIFNVADIYVTVSCFLLLILLFFVYSEQELQVLMRSRKRERYLKELSEKIRECKREEEK